MPRNPNKIDYTGSLPSSFESFSVISEPRSSGNTNHYFGDVLFLCVTALLCGMNGFAEISHFGNLQKDRYKKWGNFSHGIPKGQTLCNIFATIDPDLFQKYLIDHVQQLHPELQAVAASVKILFYRTDPVAF